MTNTSNVIENARKALEWYEDDSEGGGGIVLGGMAVADALRELLEETLAAWNNGYEEGWSDCLNAPRKVES